MEPIFDKRRSAIGVSTAAFSSKCSILVFESRDDGRAQRDRKPAETRERFQDFKGRMANGCPFDLHDLNVTLHGNERRVRRSQAKLRSFVLASDLSSPFH